MLSFLLQDFELFNQNQLKYNIYLGQILQAKTASQQLKLRIDMSEARKFQINSEDVKKLNIILPKGYQLVTQQQFRKRAMSKPKKKTIMGLPVTPQIVNTSISLNLLQDVYQSPTVSPAVVTNTIRGRSAKNTKFMGLPSYESIPESEYYAPAASKSYDKIPISLDYYSFSQKKDEILSTPVVFSKLKNHPQICQLDKVEPEMYSLSFRDIERNVNAQKDNYKVSELVSDISKLCLKIYESYSRESNQYQNTVSIEKYLKSLTRVQKPQPIQQSSSSVGLTRQPSTVPQIKKRPPVRMNDFNAAITIKQKRQLGQRIKKLPSQSLQQICYIVFENLENKQYSFDLDTLHLKKIRQLQEYVNSCLDFSQLSQNDQQNRINDQEQGQESSFIIQDDGEEDHTNLYDYQ